MEAREWLREKGYHVAAKGRIRADLQALWDTHQRGEHDRSGDSDHPGGDDVRGDALPSDSKQPRRRKRTSCGFCTVRAEHQHRLCPGTIDQGKAGVWTCLCYEKEHNLYAVT